jgi:phosphoserine phosphatase
VATLAQSGAEIWAVSSTNKWVVAEGVRAFGIPEERILAADARIENGLISSEIVDVPTDEGKAASLARAGLAHPDAAFGNSIHDLAMLKAARNAFPVNPSPALIDAAAKNGWGCFWPREAEGVHAAVPGKSS